MNRFLIWLLLILPLGIVGQSRVTISGKVSDFATKSALEGVTIMEKGSTNGTASGTEGLYSLDVLPNSTVAFSRAGYLPYEVLVTEAGVLDVALHEDAMALEEVVIIGYGAVKKSDLTSSISSVKGEDLQNMTSGNALYSLQGKAAGVQITASGGPGATPRVLIRGVTTINGTEPLYVVDGFPISGNINFLNQDDIESIEVLKDASASAIYGTRASNGVILVTTKKGKAGKTQFQLNSSFGMQTLSKPDLADASVYEQVFKERYVNDGNTPIWNTPENSTIDTDWWDQTIRKVAHTNSHSLGFQGGSEKLVYSGSLGYFRQSSQYNVGHWERITGRFNTEYKFSKVVKAGLNFAPKHENWQNTPNLFGGVMRMDPTTPVFRSQDQWDTNALNNYARSYNNQEWNPVANVARSNSNNQEYGMMLIPFLSIQPIEQLTFRTQYSVNANFRMGDTFTPQFFIDNLERNDLSKAERGANHWVNWNWTNTVNYMDTFAGKHNLNLMAGFTMEKFSEYILKGSRDGVPSNHPDLQYVDAGTLNFQSSGTNIYNSLVSYLGRAMYNYDNRYYVTASVRTDGSSRFPSGSQYATFPAVSVAWRMSEESFMKDLPWLSDLKIRAGWGRVGNQNIDPNAYLNLIGAADYVFGPEGDRQIGTAISLVGNNLLRWETVEDKNLGLDASFLDGRLSITADVFNKVSKDMLMKRQNLSLLGYPMWAGEMWTNIGSMRARGWEFSTNWRDKQGDFSYDVGVNLSSIKNTAITLVDNTPVLRGGFFNDYIIRNEEGGEISRFYGYIADGVFQNQTEINSHSSQYGDILQPDAKPGDIRFRDLNNDGVLNEKDKTFIGSAFPDLTLGFNVRLGYKNVDFVSSFYGSFGNDIYNSAMGGFYAGTNGQNVFADAYDKAWRGEGTSYFYPRLSVNDQNLNFRRVSSFFVEDGSYLRCNLMQIGYTLPSSLTRGVGVRLSASGQNLFTITNYSGMDPERAGQGDVLESGIDNLGYPNPRTFLFGINLKF